MFKYTEEQYPPRFVRVGDVGFDMEKVTNFVRIGEQVRVYFSVDDAVLFRGADAETVWKYLTGISIDLGEEKE